MSAHSSTYRNARKRALRDATRCAHCGREVSDLYAPGHPLKLTADHVIPRALGGPHTVENLIPSCAECNSSRGAKDLDWRSSTHVDGADDW